MSTIFQAQFGQIELILGNIVEQNVDVIVNTANTKLIKFISFLVRYAVSITHPTRLLMM